MSNLPNLCFFNSSEFVIPPILSSHRQNFQFNIQIPRADLNNLKRFFNNFVWAGTVSSELIKIA